MKNTFTIKVEPPFKNSRRNILILKRNFRLQYRLVLLALLNFACNENNMFVPVSASRSGIDFVNVVKETEDVNILNYLYTYNGAGVAVGDVNNDGLTDIFLVSNQESNRLYLNRGNLKFEDVTDRANFPVNDENGWNTGVSMVDINQDGWLDIYVCRLNGVGKIFGKNQLFINNGDATFIEHAAQYGLDIATYSQHAAFFDYDKDGDLDMYLLNQALHTPKAFKDGTLRNKKDAMAGDRLYQNNNGFFEEVSEQAGIYSGAMGYGLSVAIADVDDNGFPDIYVSNDFHENDYLYYNQGDGTFKENITNSFGHVSTFSMGNAIADLNNDGLLDIITLDMRPEDEILYKKSMPLEDYDIYQLKKKKSYHDQIPRNMLQRNQGKLFGDFVSFSEIGEISGISSTDWSWGVLAADFDLDGYKDLFITNGIPRRPNDLDFIKYTSDKVYEDENFDFDKVINAMPEGKAHNMMFKNIGDKFEKVSFEWGFDDIGVSNGAVYADLDGDGDLDIVVNKLNAQATIYENTIKGSGELNNHITIKLIGNENNINGIGARVILKTKNNEQIQEVNTSIGWLSSINGDLIFGIGTAEKGNLTVKWSDGSTQEVKNILANSKIKVYQSEAKENTIKEKEAQTILVDITSESGIDFIHKENDYIDFKYEGLLPRMISKEGPKLAVGDVNNDGLDDFYIGGAKDQEGHLYLQQVGSEFIFARKTVNDFYEDRANEDVDAEFFDIDSDGDLDLYVVSGSGELLQDFSSTDRIYINDGQGNFRKIVEHPKFGFNGSCVEKADFNEDGIDDLFVGARSIPGKYGKSYKSRVLFGLGNGSLLDVTDKLFGNRINLGMVTDAVWLKDSRELAVVGEWMPLTIIDFKNQPLMAEKIYDTNGWWSAIHATDFDADGAVDLFLGNFGDNSNLRASKMYPVNLYLKDFDGNSRIDPILTHFKNGTEYPYFGLDLLSGQLPSMKKLYTSYKEFSESPFSEVFSSDDLLGSGRLQAFTFSSTFFKRRASNKFDERILPFEMQWSPIFAFASDDFDGDGRIDVLAAGNFFDNQLMIGRTDASYGHYFTTDSLGNLEHIEPLRSGFRVTGQVRDIKILKGTEGLKYILISRNNEGMLLFSYASEHSNSEM